MSRVSVWWPTPYRASRWFDDATLEASERYHRPLRRAALGRTAAKLGLIGVGQLWLLGRSAGESGGTGPVTDWLVGAVVLAVGWWLPASMVDGWFEFRHEPRFGHTPLSAHRFAVGSGITLVATLVVALIASVFVKASIDWAGEQWWALIAVAMMVALVVIAVIGAAMSRIGHQIEPLDDAELFRAIGEELGLNVSFARMRSDSIVGLNALTIGWRRVDVVVTADLLIEPDELQQHVVAHELSHVRHMDTVTSMSTAALAEGLALGALAMALPFDFASDGRWFPSLVVLAAVCVALARVVLAWLSRAHERRADLEAHRLVGPTPEWALRRLHLTDRADLCPPWWVRLVATHPSPGERLELAHSHRSSALRSVS